MYLGLDLGTSGIKAMLVDDDFATIGVAHAPLTVSRPHPGWSEQDPADWIAGAEKVIGDLARQHPDAMARLRAIGLSGHMHGATLLDRGDQVLRPCILWNDGRSGPQCAELAARADFHGIAGNLVMAGFTAPKLLWVAENEPEIFERTAKVLLPKDYLRLWLTGEHVGEMSDAAGTLWLDVARRDWSDELLAATGLSRAQMPALVEGSDVSGTLRADLAVGGIDGICRNDEADTRHGQCEYDEQDIALREEDGACQKDEQKEAEDVEAFRLIDGDRLLSPQLQEIIEGLQEGRPLSSLHTGGDDAVAPGKQSAKDRR